MYDIKYHVLTEAETDSLERTAHNPPVYSASFAEEDFQMEWKSVQTRLHRMLDIFGEEWTVESDKGDFILQECNRLDRWIYVTFRSTRLWRPEFVVAVVALLRDLPQAYAVGCLTELNDDEIINEPLVYLVITTDGVSGKGEEMHRDPEGKVQWGADGMPVTIEANGVLKRFGFPPSLVD